MEEGEMNILILILSLKTKICSTHRKFEIFGKGAIRHMWRVGNGLDNACLERTS